MIVSNITKENIICPNTRVADTFFTRLKGLLGKTDFASDEGLLIIPCQSVHSVGMKFSIDVVFLDNDRQVVALLEKMRPFRCSKFYRDAKMALEIKEGKIQEMRIEIGDQLKFTCTQKYKGLK